MFPVLANVGPFTVSSLGVMFSLAFFCGSFRIWKKMKEEHFEDNDIFDGIFLSFFGGLIFSRLFFVLVNFPMFRFDFSKWISLTYSNGFSWMGFLIGTMIMLSIVAKKKKWDYWLVLDLSTYGVIISQILVSLGRFLDGSYYGEETNMFWGIRMPGLTGKRHPVVFYELLILIILIILVNWLEKRYRLFKWYQNKRGKANPGFLWLFYLGIFMIYQFIIDVLMDRTTVFGPFSSYQIFLMFGIIILGFIFWLRAGNELNLIDEERKEMKIIRPASNVPVKQLERREVGQKRFSRAKVGQDIK